MVLLHLGSFKTWVWLPDSANTGSNCTLTCEASVPARLSLPPCCLYVSGIKITRLSSLNPVEYIIRVCCERFRSYKPKDFTRAEYMTSSFFVVCCIRLFVCDEMFASAAPGFQNYGLNEYTCLCSMLYTSEVQTEQWWMTTGLHCTCSSDSVNTALSLGTPEHCYVSGISLLSRDTETLRRE